MGGTETGSRRSSKMWDEVGTGNHEQWEEGDGRNRDGKRSSIFAKIATGENTSPVDTPNWVDSTVGGKEGQNGEPEVNYTRKMTIMDDNKLKDES